MFLLKYLYLYHFSLYTDVNECKYGSHNCDVNANCTNTEGSFNCSCNPGYTGNGTYCNGKIQRFKEKKNIKKTCVVFIVISKPLSFFLYIQI